jgi:hypothetical protein
MEFNQEHFAHRCEIAFINNDQIASVEFDDIQNAYLWMCKHINIRVPQNTNISLINGIECMSFKFMRDLLNLKMRNSDMKFNVEPFTSLDNIFMIYYLPQVINEENENDNNMSNISNISENNSQINSENNIII